jgi:hypothetical protein
MKCGKTAIIMLEILGKGKGHPVTGYQGPSGGVEV